MADYKSYYLYQKYIKYPSNPDWIPAFPSEYSVSGDTENPMPLVVKETAAVECGYKEDETIYRWFQSTQTGDTVCYQGDKYYKEYYQVSYDNGVTWQNVSPEQSRRSSVVYQYDVDDCYEYKWTDMDISTDYICSGTSKYYKQIKQRRYIEGGTWEDVTPAEYQRGDLYEVDSTDCGYIEPVYRWVNLPITETYICSGTSKYYKQQRQVSYDNGSTWSNVSPAEYQQGELYETNSVDCFNGKWIAKYTDDSVLSADCSSDTDIEDEIQATNIVEVKIGDCVTYIGKYSPFRNCTTLTSVTISNSININAGPFSGGFRGCTHLSRLNSNTDGVVKIPRCLYSSISMGNAFRNCQNVTYIECSAEEIGAYTFANCTGLLNIDLVGYVTAIYSAAFSNCTSLNSIRIVALTPPTLAGDAFTNTPSEMKIYVPSSSVNDYKTASGWSTYADRIYPIT